MKTLTFLVIATLSVLSPTFADDSLKASYRDLSFTVTSTTDDKGETQFTVTPSGLSESNEPITTHATGRVISILADDMDGDDSPEVAVMTESEGQKRRAHVFSTFNRKSFGQVHFPALTDPELLSGYHGGDEYAFVENTFIRRFPVQAEADGQPSDKTRQLQFKLKPGEAMKQLVLDRTIEYGSEPSGGPRKAPSSPTATSSE